MSPSLRTKALVATTLLLAAMGIAADPHDHDRALAALERGEVRPMSEILTAVGGEVPGDVVEVELEREHGRWMYELKVLAPDGRVLEVLVDAATAEVLGLESD
ncbi:MAG: PepSY domain-containing protein [Thiohalocapsa sp.]